MRDRVVLALGPGTVSNGFPAVTARLEQTSGSWLQATGSLPAAAELVTLYRNWQLLYEALYQGRRRSGIEIEPASITHISASEFGQVQQQLVQQLNQWLSSDSFRPIETQLRNQLDPDCIIRIAIETDDSSTWRLPWHCWDLVRQDFRHAEILLSTPTYPAAPTAKLRDDPAPMQLLAILGDRTGINVEQDRQLLKRLPGAVPTLLDEPQRRDLTDQLWASGWDILFFAGHSSSQPDATGGRLYINQQAQHNSLTVAELQEALHQAVDRGLQLAIFNSCDGLGLVRDLAAAGVPLPVTIAMREPVPDIVAQEFLKYFLQRFAYGEPFYRAVRQAREQLKGLEDEYPGASWLPVVCQHPAAEPPIWPELSEKAPAEALPKVEVDVAPPPPIPNRRFAKRWRWVAIAGSVVAIASYPLWGVWAANQINEHGIQQYKQQRKLLAAKQSFRIATMLDPFNPAPHYNLGWLCDQALDDLDCAHKAFWRAAKLGRPAAYAEAARAEIMRGNFTAALKAIKSCLTVTRSDVVTTACLKNRAWIRIEENDRIDEAERDLRKAIHLEPDSPHAHCLLAQVLEAQGREVEARESWRNAQTDAKGQEHVPELDECLRLINQRLQLQGDLQ